MATALLDLNDSNVQLWHNGKAVQSPGYALLEGSQYTFGNAARGAARLRPRDINTRYWWQLNTEGLQPALGPARHTADLVHAHLLDIHSQGGKPEDLILAVSGSMQRDQLALLLGIVERCPFNAVGLVNRSVALASAYPGSGSVYHLEIQLHQAVISELSIRSGEVALGRVNPLPGCGLLQLQERLIEIIAAAFIRQTRFDPRRKAESEQQLYDALPALLHTLGADPATNAEANVEVMGYSARINNAELSRAGQLLFDATSQSLANVTPQDHILLDPLCALLPGLQEQFPLAKMVDTNALLQAVEHHVDHLVPGKKGSALNFITSLPCHAQPDPSTADEQSTVTAIAATPAAPAMSSTTEATATHLLVHALATPLSAAGTQLAPGWELYCEAGDWLLRGEGWAQVNGEQYFPGQVLHCGDRIVCAGGKSDGAAGFSARLIAVVIAPG